MSTIARIRFLTYAMLAAAYLWPAPKRNVIPVDLSAPPPDYIAIVDELYRKRQASEDVARSPGFETTRRSGSEVMRLALEVARKDADLDAFRPPTTSLHSKEGKLVWHVHWERKGMPIPGGFFAVQIDDETGATKFIPGM